MPDSVLSAISCPSVGYCVAGGSYLENTFVGDDGLLDTLSDDAWTTMQAPVPASASTGSSRTSVNSVSCSSVGSCITVGDYISVNGEEGLIDALSNGNWSPLQAPLPGNAASRPAAILNSVSCSSDGTCAAIGQYVDTSGFIEMLIDTLSAGIWNAISAPDPSNANNAPMPSTALFGVSCALTATCVVVGRYLTTRVGGDAGAGLIDTFSDGRWSAAEAPLPADAPAGAFDQLNAVSCTSSSACTAVGSYNATSVDPETGAVLTESLSAGSWGATVSPLPNGMSAAYLDSVSCTPGGGCAAVGLGDENPQGTVAFAATVSDGTWTTAVMPLPGNANLTSESSLGSVSCTSDDQCTAVGTYSRTFVNDTALIATLSAGQWTTVQAPLPNNVGQLDVQYELLSVSCTRADACTAVGAYPTSSGGNALIEAGVGSLP